MSRPRSEAEYLARLIPPSASATSMGRRSSPEGRAGRWCGPGTSRVPRRVRRVVGRGEHQRCGRRCQWRAQRDREGRVQLLRRRAEEGDAGGGRRLHREDAGVKVAINTVDHNTFQENINNYLQGKPDDVFTWFAGYRMRFFAAQGLAGDISDVWGKLTGFTRRLQEGLDRRRRQAVLRARSTYYPWAVFYRTSRCGRQKGYTVPKTLDEFKALAAQMKKDGLVPDRLRRQGRLAGDGHLRHPQHADQRLPVPRRPDGRQGGVDRPRGQEGLRHLGRAAPAPPARLARPHLAGGRRSRCSRRRRACTCSASSSPQQFTDDERTTSTSSPSPRSTRRSAPTRSTRRSTAS